MIRSLEAWIGRWAESTKSRYKEKEDVSSAQTEFDCAVYGVRIYGARLKPPNFATGDHEGLTGGAGGANRSNSPAP